MSAISTWRLPVSTPSKLFAIAFTASAGLLIFIVLIIGVMFLSQLGRWKKYSCQNTTLQITNSSIIQQTPYNRSEIYWNTIDRIRKSRNYFFIYIMSSEVLIVPRESFQDENQAENFFQRIQENLIHA